MSSSLLSHTLTLQDLQYDATLPNAERACENAGRTSYPCCRMEHYHLYNRSLGRQVRKLKNGALLVLLPLSKTSFQIPGYPNLLAQGTTSDLSAAISAFPSIPFSKSFSFLPWLSWTLMAMLQHLCRNSPICLLSSSLHPRVVIAGMPTRTPPGDRAEASPWTAFLFSVMDTASVIFSSFEPVSPCGRRSHNNKWLS